MKKLEYKELMEKSLAELKEIAKKEKIKGYTKAKNKSELARKINKFFYNKPRAEEFFKRGNIDSKGVWRTSSNTLPMKRVFYLLTDFGHLTPKQIQATRRAMNKKSRDKSIKNFKQGRIDKNGIFRWNSNNEVPFSDMLEKFHKYNLITKEQLDKYVALAEKFSVS